MRFGPPTEADWPAILDIADASAPTKAPDNPGWLERRRTFPGQKHHIVARIDSDRVVGFGAAEYSGDGQWRIFVVVPPDMLESVGDEIYRAVEASLRGDRVQGLWAREEPVDRELIAFFVARGFTATAPEATPTGQLVVVLTKPGA